MYTCTVFQNTLTSEKLSSGTICGLTYVLCIQRSVLCHKDSRRPLAGNPSALLITSPALLLLLHCWKQYMPLEEFCTICRVMRVAIVFLIMLVDVRNVQFSVRKESNSMIQSSTLRWTVKMVQYKARLAIAWTYVKNYTSVCKVWVKCGDSLTSTAQCTVRQVWQ